MKKVLLLLTILGISGLLSAQTLTKSQMIGHWRVQEVQLQEEILAKELGQEQLPANRLAALKSMFASIEVVLRANHSADFLTEVPELNVRSGRWTYDAPAGVVTILDAQGELVVRIEVLPEDRSIYFVVEDFPGRLAVKRSPL